MKIYLFLQNKIMTFLLPQKVYGSFSFDEDPEEELKLINIEARDDKWHILSTTYANVISNGAPVINIPLVLNNYYIIKRGNIDYVIYVTNPFDNTFSLYKYNQNFNLIVGNDSSCNFLINNNLISGVAFKLYIKENKININTFSNIVYLNKVVLPFNSMKIIKSGDQITLYNLRIVFLNDLVLINNPSNSFRYSINNIGLLSYQFPQMEQPRDIVIKEVDLYSKEQFFSKAPRLRRTIKTKEIDLSPPPTKEEEKDMPIILTIGPMLTMGVVSGVMLINTISKIVAKTTTLNEAWPTLATSSAMIISMVLWPSLTKNFEKKYRERKKKELQEKYNIYLSIKRKELEKEYKLQEEILYENLVTIEDCIKFINVAKINFWDKRIDQNDFLDVRVGKGNRLLELKVNYPKQGFTIEEDELKKQAENMIQEFMYIKNVPISYSLYKSKITAIMGLNDKCYGLIHNIILQLITFYSYEDIKIVVITNSLKEDNWDYIKYLNHSFSNDKSFRFFSSNYESSKQITEFLNNELKARISKQDDKESYIYKPHYVIITDDYPQIKLHQFIKNLVELEENMGFSMIILENHMSKLPSRCNNFINLGPTTSGILKNSVDDQQIISFSDEIVYGIDMMEIAKKLSNIPIEFENGNKVLPEVLPFLEMEKVGKVEQLNVMNRWDTNDSTSSLKAEIGVDEDGNLMYLDLHEKFHGPHGLIAGMTGSGKSEFIITYILSMAINYSPDYVSFMLIDYKGGGLAFAFENKSLGISLPHLAGTITNLDKAEMNRSLVSIDSEIKRRQQKFNETRDKMGISTIDIYKYQKFYKEGKVTEPIPHLFIICDEFAELKSQQPEFMDNLISVARIGRSLGIHLILATQKPSGVVNDQIWSNTKFRVCLKVQDDSDSKEMLKRPEAASLKQVGRYYLQVGYDEYFALGQSAWCGAKYYPSEKVLKHIDKSIKFIDDTGNIIKNMQEESEIKIKSYGEQLEAILKNVIDISNRLNKKVRKLWLDDIEPIILIDDLEKKYGFSYNLDDISVIIGEYDAPEKQEQGLLIYSIKKHGNTIIYGNDEVEREKILNTILYSILKNYSVKEANIYIIDYGSEQLRMFNNFPQIGGIVFSGETEKFKNLFKLIIDEIKRRKKALIPYGGFIENYNNNNEVKMPQILFILNNYEGIAEEQNSIYEEIISIARECERYGVTMLITSSSPMSISRRIVQYFSNVYAFYLTDSSDYYEAFNVKCGIIPKSILGRGLVNNDTIHEFQTASITTDDYEISGCLEKLLLQVKNEKNSSAAKIPSLPDKVTFDIVENDITDLANIPIGIAKSSLKIVKYNFITNKVTLVSSNKLDNIISFMDSLLSILLRFNSLNIFFIDTLSIIPSANKQGYNNKVSYYNNHLDIVISQFIEIENSAKYDSYKKMYIIYGIEKLQSKVDKKIIEMFIDKIINKENSIIIICDSVKNLKSLSYESWYDKIKNDSDGIWIGKGIWDQSLFKINNLTRDMNENSKNNYGFYVSDNEAKMIKLIEFNNFIEEDEVDE